MDTGFCSVQVLRCYESFCDPSLGYLSMSCNGACDPCSRQEEKKKTDLSANPLGNVNSRQPDKELFDKAMVAMKKGKFDVARLDLQTLLNTYPDTEYAMRAKLAVGDTWYKEGDQRR